LFGSDLVLDFKYHFASPVSVKNAKLGLTDLTVSIDLKRRLEETEVWRVILQFPFSSKVS
jgi:hypothetical protein